MDSKLIFFPVIAQIALTLYTFIALAIAKNRALKDSEVDEKRRSLHTDAWPDSVIKINNNIRNQFEVPILFYVLCIVLWASNGVGVLALIIASLFVISRCFHLYVHTGSNFVPLRKKLFMFGCVMVLFLTLLCVISLIKGVT